jgi:hypothetical protein
MLARYPNNPKRVEIHTRRTEIHLNLLHENSSLVIQRLIDLDDILPLPRSTPLPIVWQVLLWRPTI